jgi:hypothetical protein
LGTGTPSVFCNIYIRVGVLDISINTFFPVVVSNSGDVGSMVVAWLRCANTSMVSLLNGLMHPSVRIGRHFVTCSSLKTDVFL